jgi:5'-methylthioadenosine phosphorylase
MIVRNLQQNARNAQAIIARAVALLPERRSCRCGHALQYAMITDKSRIPEGTRKKLSHIIGKYFAS